MITLSDIDKQVPLNEHPTAQAHRKATIQGNPAGIDKIGAGIVIYMLHSLENHWLTTYYAAVNHLLLISSSMCA